MKKTKKQFREDYEIIKKIVTRGLKMDIDSHIEGTKRMDADMDIDSAHQDVNLDLDKFLAFDDANFGHDWYGIRRYMIRDTYPGKLGMCFLPRCTATKCQTANQ